MPDVVSGCGVFVRRGRGAGVRCGYVPWVGGRGPLCGVSPVKSFFDCVLSIGGFRSDVRETEAWERTLSRCVQPANRRTERGRPALRVVPRSEEAKARVRGQSRLTVWYLRIAVSSVVTRSASVSVADPRVDCDLQLQQHFCRHSRWLHMMMRTTERADRRTTGREDRPSVPSSATS